MLFERATSELNHFENLPGRSARPFKSAIEGTAAVPAIRSAQSNLPRVDPGNFAPTEVMVA
jgi:hypothetical protein